MCLVVQGDPGIGKTQLLGELRRRADERGSTVLAGSSAEFERDLPLGVWVDALDTHVASLEDDGWDADLQAELALILPSVGAPDDAATGLPDERYRVHRAMRKLLGLLAATQPLVLVLDDLHWSDPASIELISSIVQRGVDAPVLIALGLRSGQVPRGLGPALAAPSCRDHRARGPSARTRAPSWAASARTRGRRRPSTPRAAATRSTSSSSATRTGGRAHRRTATPPPRRPRRLIAALSQELDAVPPRGRKLLDGAAVAGDPFDLELATAIAELDHGEGVEALDELLDPPPARADGGTAALRLPPPARAARGLRGRPGRLAAQRPRPAPAASSSCGGGSPRGPPRRAR